MYTKSQLLDLVEILGGNGLIRIFDPSMPLPITPPEEIHASIEPELADEDLHKQVTSLLTPEKLYHEVLTSWISRGKSLSSGIGQKLPFFQTLPPQCLANSVKLRFFDQIYVLNLDRRIDRWERMKRQLAKHQIHDYQRFSAIDAQDPIVFREWNNYQRTPLTWSEKRHKLKKKGIASAGSWAILSGMKKMLLEAWDSGYRRILVLQDDLIFHRQFMNEIEHLVIPDDWKLLYLGASQHTWGSELKFEGCGYHPMGTADGAFAVGIDRSVFHQLIREIDRRELPFDSGALSVIQKTYPEHCWVIYPNLIIADVRESDLRGFLSLTKLGNKFRWNLSLYDLEMSLPLKRNAKN